MCAPLAARGAVVLLALLALAPPALAQDRPSEDELFGAPAEERPAQAEPGVPERPPAPSQQPGESRRPDDAEIFGPTGSPKAVPPPPARAEGPGEREPQASVPPERGFVSKERDDPLRLGGQLYLRLQASSPEDTAPGDWTTTSPNLLDVFLDVRPNERVRAFALGRLAYDAVVSQALLGLPPDLAAALGLEPLSNPRAVLDQLWVNFDLGRKVFVTAGRQHVKWGVGRFWNPTDFLHREPRDPLDVFDARTGTAMVKAHLPWEARGWNAYAVALLEDPRLGGGDSAGTVRGVPLGGRVELVLGTMELGADVLAGDGARPRYGLDVSAGVWELDLYAEVALGAGRARWRVRDPAAPLLAPAGLGRYALEGPDGSAPRVVAGGSWSAMYSDEDAVTVGAEYSYQEDGYRDREVYPFLLFGAPALVAADVPVFRQDPAAFSAFYLGRHYAGAFVSLPAPGAWNDTTFTLSVLGNLSDRSFVARLDHSVLALTYLRVETFVAGHLGRRGGEFRLGVALPPQVAALGGPASLPTPAVDVGIALRVSL